MMPRATAALRTRSRRALKAVALSAERSALVRSGGAAVAEADGGTAGDDVE